ncbi:uncharacterized protein JCM6883_004290 [Sporobolomyces salmoneus]|uniref:uncharacterized protein n=1 Tax=Sporobolomyces salmoneus TaxID=183962 RepID=UPI003173E713
MTISTATSTTQDQLTASNRATLSQSSPESSDSPKPHSPCPILPYSPTICPSSPSSYDLPCPAAVLHSPPHLPPSAVDQDENSNGQAQFRHTRCHFRSQDMLEAAHLQPGEARWECKLDQGRGLELTVAPTNSHVSTTSTGKKKQPLTAG